MRPGWLSAVLLAILFVCSPAFATEGWGTIKGRVVYSGKARPAGARPAQFVLNPKNQGVRWVIVWLAPLKDFKDPRAGHIPIHPSRQKAAQRVKIDLGAQPRVTALREGTEVVFENTLPGPGPLLVNGGPLGPNVEEVIAAGAERVVKDIPARFLPFTYAARTKGWLAVYKHPYFAVTDADGNFEIKNAPAGKWRLIAWHEYGGWVVRKSGKDIGVIVEIKAGATTTQKFTIR
jgi:hypothetical protein